MNATTDKPKTQTLKLVEQTIDLLEKKGISPTQRNVIKEIGGSFTTIGPAVSVVKAQRAAREKILTAVPSVPDEIQEGFADLWAQAYRSADENHSLERQKFAETVAEKEAEVTEIQEITFDLEKKLCDREAELEACQCDLQDREQQVKQLELKLHAAEAKLAERAQLAEMLAALNAQSNGTVSASASPFPKQARETKNK